MVGLLCLLIFASGPRGFHGSSEQIIKCNSPEMKKSSTQESGNTLVTKEQITKAVQALCKYVQKKEDQSMNLAAADEGHDIQLQLCMRRVPRTKNVKIKIGLPTSLVSDTTDVCLFVKDLDKQSREHEVTSRHFKEMFVEKGINNIAEVIPLKALKLEYQPYEAKRNLSNMYDIYLADARIMHRLPPLLGKSFYSRKRYPIQVDLEAKDLQTEFKKALHTTQCIITGRGSSCLTVVAHTGLSTEQITDNIDFAIKTLSEKIPGGQENVHSLHIKTTDSMAIPLFVCFSSGEGIDLPTRPKAPTPDEPEEISTIMGVRVRVTPSGSIEVIKVGTDEVGGEADENTQQKGDQSKKLQKNRKRKAKSQHASQAAVTKDSDTDIKCEPDDESVSMSQSDKKLKKLQEPSSKKTKEETKTLPKTTKKRKLAK